MSMDIQLDALAAAAKAQPSSDSTYRAPEEDFLKVMEALRQSMQLETADRRQKAQEAEAKAAKEAREKRIEALRALIAQLKAKLAASGNSPAVAAQLSAAQTELFWLLCAI